MVIITNILEIEQHLDGITSVIFDLDDTLYSEKQYVRSGYKAVAKVHQGRDFFHSLSGGEDACPLRRLFVQEKIFFQAGLDRRADLCII